MAGFHNIWGTNDKLLLRFKGTSDIDELYKASLAWFKDKGLQFHEHFAKAKHSSPVGEEIFWRWMVFRNVNEYLRFQADIHWHFWDLEPVEIMVDGKKKTMHKGRLTVIIKGQLITDYENRYETSVLKNTLRKFLDSIVLLPRLHLWSSHFEYLMHEFHELLKQKLGMQMDTNPYHGDR